MVIAGNFAGMRTFDGTSVHTGSNGDDDFLILDLDASLRVTRVSRFGNGGGDQFLADLAPAPDGAVLIAGSFETKLDLGWGVMRTAALSDAFLARITKDSPAPGVSTPSAGEQSLPANFTAPAPPQVSCDPAAREDLRPARFPVSRPEPRRRRIPDAADLGRLLRDSSLRRGPLRVGPEIFPVPGRLGLHGWCVRVHHACRDI